MSHLTKVGLAWVEVSTAIFVKVECYDLIPRDHLQYQTLQEGYAWLSRDQATMLLGLELDDIHVLWYQDENGEFHRHSIEPMLPHGEIEQAYLLAIKLNRE